MHQLRHILQCLFVIPKSQPQDTKNKTNILFKKNITHNIRNWNMKFYMKNALKSTFKSLKDNFITLALKFPILNIDWKLKSL